MATRPLSYTINSSMVGGQWRGFVRVRCAGCGEVTKIQWNSYHNPNQIAQRFRQLSWEFDPYRARGNRCPKCAQPILLEHRPPVGPPVSGLVAPLFQSKKPTPILPDFSTFGKRLRWTREQVRLSQDQLAAETQINTRLLQHIEGGTANDFIHFGDLAVDRLVSVLTEHGATIDADWLIGKKVPAPETTPPPPKPVIAPNGQANGQARPVTVPAVIKPEPKPALTRLLKPTIGDDHRGVTLRNLRIEHGLTQTSLATKMLGNPGIDSLKTLGSVQALLSSFERSGHITESTRRLFAVATTILESPQELPAKRARLAPPPKRTQPPLPTVTAEALQTELRRAENDLAELRKMLDDLEPIRQMVAETTQRVEGIRKVLATLTA